MQTTSVPTTLTSHEEIVDQRELPLPPTWAATRESRRTVDERGQHVHASGKRRVIANLIVDMLAVAAEKVVVSSFLLADRIIEDALLATAKRGVRVYVLLASEARLGKEEGEGEFDKRVLEQHKAMLMRIGGHVLFRSASHFHAKIVVVDPETRPAGLLLTANLTVEALERNEELAIVMKANEARAAASYAKWAMWESAEHELVDPKDRFRGVQPLGQVEHPRREDGIVATTTKARSIHDDLLALIDGARTEIIVSSFGWDDGHPVVRRLCARAQEGLTVTVLARVRPASMPALLALANAGAKVVGFRWLHAKAIWADADRALVMSANLQKHGLDDGFELGVQLSDERAREVRDRLVGWRDNAPWTLFASATLGAVSGAAIIWTKGRLEEVAIAPEHDVDLGVLPARSAEAASVPRVTLPSNGELPRLAHRVRYTWTVQGARLADESNGRDVGVLAFGASGHGRA